MKLFASSLTYHDIEPFLNTPTLYLKIRHRHGNQVPFNYCGVVKPQNIEFSPYKTKDEALRSISFLTEWCIETLYVVKTSPTRDFKILRPVANYPHYLITMEQPRKNRKGDILYIFHGGDHIELSSQGRVKIMVLTMYRQSFGREYSAPQ